MKVWTGPISLFAAAITVALLAPEALADFYGMWYRNYNVGSIPAGIAVDGEGSICVLANYERDIVTMKYAPNGTQLWAQRFGGSGREWADAIAADAAGNVWVVGDAETNGLLTLKYASNGTLLWTQRFSETNISTYYSRIAVDSAGNAYVATGINGELIAIKYSPNGTQLWARRYENPGYVTVRTIAIDSAGDLVIGAEGHAIGFGVFLVQKYDPSGNLLWTAADNLFETDGLLMDMAVDASDNVFVAGFGMLAIGESCCKRHHLLTAKYSSSGLRLWAVARPPREGCNAVARAIRVDGDGNAIVTGYESYPVSEDEDGYDLITVKYDPSGRELWGARSPYDRTPETLAVDQTGNIYVGGMGSDYSSYLVLLKYAPNGSQIAESTVRSVYLSNFAMDRTGNIYTVGGHYNYTPDGGSAVEVWKFAQVANPSQPTVTVSPRLVQVLPGGNVTLTATASGPGPFTYRWRKLGPFSSFDRTQSSVQLTGVKFEDSGNYSVIVSNASGYAISPEVRVEVYSPPAILAEPLDQYVAVGQSVTFSPSVSGSLFGANTYQWYFNGALLPGATNRVLTLPNAQLTSAGNYSLRVSNPVASTTTREARLQFVSSVVSAETHVPLSIPDSGPAQPYPSVIAIQGATGTLSKVVVTLYWLNHTVPSDLDLLLVGPAGQTVVLMSDAGRPTASPVTLMFDDDASSSVPYPFGTDRLQTGTFKPTNYAAEPNDTFPAPAPPPPYGDSLAVFNDTDPNGTWRLFVVDDQEEDFGQIDGWGLTLIGVGGNVVVPPCLYIGRPDEDGEDFPVSWDGAPGLRLQRSSSLINPVWTDVPDSDGVSRIYVPIFTGPEFFRLMKR